MCISFRPEYFWLNSAASSQRRSTAPRFLSSLPGLGLAFTFGYAKKCLRIHSELSSGETSRILSSDYYTLSGPRPRLPFDVH